MRVGRGSAAVGLVTVALLTSGCAALGKQAPLTFSIDDMRCAPAKATGTLGNVCSFLAYYGNVGGQPVQVQPGTTTVLDRSGRSYTPVAEGKDNAAFLLRPGRQQGITWSVTLPVNASPAEVQWHGSKAAVQLQVPPSPVPSLQSSAQPSASAVPGASAVPSSVAPTTASPSPTPTATKTTPAVKPTTHKPTPTTHKPSPTAPTTTTPPPPTTPPVTITTHRPPVHHTTRPPAPTTNPTNPGGGSGGIG